MENGDVARLLDELGDRVALEDGNRFRVRAYHDAARLLRNTATPLVEIVAAGRPLTELPGIGEGIAGKIDEILVSGTCRLLEELRQAEGEGMAQLLKVPGLGPKKVRQLHRELGIDTLEDLRRACHEERLRELPGWGAASEAKLLQRIGLAEGALTRMTLDEADRQLAVVGAALDTSPAVDRWAAAGSLRRRAPTVGDLDALVVTGDRAAVQDHVLATLEHREVIGRGEEKLSLRLTAGTQVDLRFVEAEAFGAALQYFTGSREHNIVLRRRALDRGCKLNEYGLFAGGDRVAGADEAGLYAALDLAWIPPELRENRGEVEAAAAEGGLPGLVTFDGLRGDTHVHTDASDGRDGIAAMADAARERGYAWLAITDHSRSQRQAGGLDAAQLREHALAIRQEDARRDDLWLLAGVEVDILRDGRLDLDDGILAELDWVTASVHAHFDLDERRQTARLLRAVESGLVHCLGHPIARLHGQRRGIRFDTALVFTACAEYGVCLEVNGQPERLDLPDHLCRVAQRAGVTFCLASDAHGASDLAGIRYAVDVARRGWLGPGDVLNTLAADDLRAFLATAHGRTPS